MENNCYLIDIQKLKKSKDKTGGKNAYRKKRKEKKRKEKKSKGLFYLIFTLTIIAVLTISCKNKPTGSNEFAWEDVDIKIPTTKDDWKTFLNRILISEEDLNPGTDVPAYFWAEFTIDGIKYRLSKSKNIKPDFSSKEAVSLSLNVFNDKRAEFTGQDDNGNDQKAHIEFEVDGNNIITGVTVTFTAGSVAQTYLNKPIKCGKPKEPHE